MSIDKSETSSFLEEVGLMQEPENIPPITSDDVPERKFETRRNAGAYWNANGTAYIEKATEYAENGRFQIFLLVICLIAFSTTSTVPNILIKYSHAIECDYQLIQDDKKAINDVVYVCMAVGGAAWSILADTISRKWTLIFALFVYTASTVGVVFANSFLTLGVFRGICSFCRSGIICTMITFIAEFQISYFRGSMICALQLAWMMGLVVIPALPFMWKSLIIIATIPAITAMLALIFIPDSPRFLLSRGREKEAIRSLQMIHAINTGTNKINFPIQRLKDNKTPEELRRNSVVKPFIPEYMEPKFISIPIVMLAQFVIIFCYNTLSLWFPYMVSRTDAFFPLIQIDDIPQDCKVGVYYLKEDLTGFKNVEFLAENEENSTIRVTPINSAQDQTGNPCDYDNRKGFDRKSSILDALACMPSLIFLVVKIDTFGRKFFIIVAHVVAGGLAFASYFMHNVGKDLLFSCLFDSVTLLSIGAAHCLAVELFPTRVRVLGVALVIGSGQLGSILADIGGAISFGFSCVVVVALIAVSLATTAILIMTIPETTGIPLR